MKTIFTFLVFITLLISCEVKILKEVESPDEKMWVSVITKKGSDSNLLVHINEKGKRFGDFQLELRKNVSISFEWVSNNELNIYISDLGAIIKSDIGYKTLKINLIPSQ